jgi:hypothetical protein
LNNKKSLFPVSKPDGLLAETPFSFTIEGEMRQFSLPGKPAPEGPETKQPGPAVKRSNIAQPSGIWGD